MSHAGGGKNAPVFDTQNFVFRRSSKDIIGRSSRGVYHENEKERVLTGIAGSTKKIAIIATASLFTVGAVVAAVVTGVIPHGSSTPKQEDTAVTQTVNAVPEKSIRKEAASRPRPAPARVASTASVPPPCANCGVIESVESFTEKGKATGGGAVAGGLLGGILGHQIGKGTGKDLATVAGAVGGAIAGNEIEKNAGKTVRYHVGVRMNNGTQQLLTLDSAPAVAVGDHVKIVNGLPVKD
jgi:outer membrane lipoprotein SlyB